MLITREEYQFEELKIFWWKTYLNSDLFGIESNRNKNRIKLNEQRK